MPEKIFLVAAEASGDVLGADLIAALKVQRPDVGLAGIGGAAMARAGVASRMDIAGLAVLGLIDGLKAYPRVRRLVAAAAREVLAERPDSVVLIDSWGFTLRLAQRLRAAAPELTLIKYVGPQVWATRPGRAKTLAGVVDHLICIHDFEPAFYAPYGLDCTVCGHPAIGRHTPADGMAFRRAQGIRPEQRLLLVLPGSRESEIRRTAPVIWEAVRLLAADRPDLCVITVAAGPVADQVVRQAKSLGPAVRLIDETEKAGAFAAATAALATSGTVTTEVGLHHTPVVVGYRLGWATWAIARSGVWTSPYATLMNVAAGREVAPEFIQTRCTARNLAAAAGPLLDDPSRRAAQVAAQDEALGLMGVAKRPAHIIAAEAILALSRRDRPKTDLD